MAAERYDDGSRHRPQEPTPDQPLRTLMAVGLLALLSAVLALSTLTRQSIWVDEAFTVAVATAPVDRFLDDLAQNGGNMSLYLVFMRGWLSFGDSDFWLRLPSVLFTAACVPAFFVLARRFVSTRAAMAGVGLLAVSSPLLHQAQEARSYPLTTLLVIVSWIAAVRLWSQPSRSSRRLYVVAAAAVVYSHLIGLLFVAAQLLWLLAATRRDAVRAGVWIGLLVIPQLVLAFSPQAQGPSWIPETTFWTAVDALRYLAGTASFSLAPVIIGVWVAAGYIAVRGNPFAWAAAAWVLVPFLGLLAVSEVQPMLIPRYLVMCVPGAVLLLCAAWDELPRAGLGVLAVALVFGLPETGRVLTLVEPNWDDASQLLFEEGQDDEAILFLDSRHLVEHYWARNGRPRNLPQPLSSPRSWGPMQRTYTFDEDDALAVLDDSEGAWVVINRSRHFERSPERQRVLSRIEQQWPVLHAWSYDGGAIHITRYGAGN